MYIYIVSSCISIPGTSRNNRTGFQKEKDLTQIQAICSKHFSMFLLVEIVQIHLMEVALKYI